MWDGGSVDNPDVKGKFYLVFLFPLNIKLLFRTNTQPVFPKYCDPRLMRPTFHEVDKSNVEGCPSTKAILTTTVLVDSPIRSFKVTSL